MSGEWRRLGDIIRGPVSARAHDGDGPDMPCWAYQIATPGGVLLRCTRTHLGRTIVAIMGLPARQEQYLVFDASGRIVHKGPNVTPENLALLTEAGEHLEYDRGEFV